MPDANLLPPVDYQLLQWHSEGLSVRYMATRLGRPLGDTQRRLEAALESQRRVERFAEAQAARRAVHDTAAPASRRQRRDPYSDLRARVLAQWADARAYFENREPTPPSAA